MLNTPRAEREIFKALQVIAAETETDLGEIIDALTGYAWGEEDREVLRKMIPECEIEEDAPPQPAQMICNHAGECKLVHCKGQTPHDKDEGCSLGCCQFPDKVCVPWVEPVVHYSCIDCGKAKYQGSWCSERASCWGEATAMGHERLNYTPKQPSPAAICSICNQPIGNSVKVQDGDKVKHWHCAMNESKQPEPVVKENFTAVEQECEICGEVNERLTTRLICDRCYAGEGVKTPPSTVCESRRDQGLIDCKIVGGKGNELWIVDMPWGNSIALYKAVGRTDFAYIETEIGDKFLSMQAFDDPPVRAWFRK